MSDSDSTKSPVCEPVVAQHLETAVQEAAAVAALRERFGFTVDEAVAVLEVSLAREALRFAQSDANSRYRLLDEQGGHMASLVDTLASVVDSLSLIASSARGIGDQHE